jgi:3-oxoacyl-[acyl-carrier-protein] synthase I
MTAAISIEAVGMFSPVGSNTGETAASLFAGLRNFGALKIPTATAPEGVDVARAPDGEPLIVATAPLPTRLSGPERLITMARAALSQCLHGGAAASNASVILCLPTPHELALDTRAVLDQAASGLSHGGPNTSIALGRAGLCAALRRAEELLDSRVVDTCFVGGVDSLISAPRLNTLLQSSRLAWSGAPFGFVPSEGAAFLRLSRRRTRAACATIDNVSAALDEGFRAQARSDAEVLTERCRTVLESVGPQGPGLICHDVAGGRAFARELALLSARLNAPAASFWTIGESLGELGAACGPMTLAYLSFMFQRRKIVPSSAIHLMLGDCGRRGAVLVRGPRPEIGF